jgi:hypothetical protein
MREDKLTEIVEESMRDCLELGSGDKILVVADSGSHSVSEIISGAAEGLGVRSVIVDLDSYGRPLTRLPRSLGRLIEEVEPAYTFYVAGVMPGELPFRSQLVEKALDLGAGHVHMPKVTARILESLEGCRETAELIEKIHGVLVGARSVYVSSPAGTDVRVEVGRYRWRANTGVIGRGEWDNWPPGEVYTTPVSVDGVLVVDGVLGDYFSLKYGVLREPVIVEFDSGRITGISGGSIAGELYEYLSQWGCGLVAGEIGVGGNPRIREPIGNMLRDEKMPGAHIAAGDPLGASTGAEWRCSVHVDMLPLKSTVRAGSTTIVSEGRLVV